MKKINNFFTKIKCSLYKHLPAFITNIIVGLVVAGIIYLIGNLIVLIS